MLFHFPILTCLLATLGVASPTNRFFHRGVEDSYELKVGPLDTPWTSKVGKNPWPEYPRPQLQRSNWQSLNGVWQFQKANSLADVNNPPFGSNFTQGVLVPFCLESALSGVMTKDNFYSWYQTSFSVPSSWGRNRVLLNFGAVDYEATVFINRQKAGFHRGGYWSFTLDVTDYLSPNGTNDVLVFVHDPTDKDDTQIVLGKQSLYNNHIFYTPCSGIWQTVWIESAPTDHITNLDLSADMDGKVNVTVRNSGNSSSPVVITFYEPGSKDPKYNAKGSSGTPIEFEIDSPDLWSPDSPTLYNITVKLGEDTVQSYTGFRTISKGKINGVMRPLLNGKPIFPFGTLDQGFWPDGIYTPPSVEAMIWDLQLLKRVGFNMLRKHIKVEPALFYRACDEIGLLLIQDMPSMRPSVRDPANPGRNVPVGTDEAQAEFNRQLEVMVHQLKNYPSIFTWMIYNEGWAQETRKGYPEFPLTEVVRSIDPTRLVNSVSGWHDHGAGDYHDNHHYANPQCGTPFYSIASTPHDPNRIAIQGEFGGVGHNVSEQHLWKVQWPVDHINETYELDATAEIWNYRSHIFLSDLAEQTARFSCAGGVWTQTTDVEGEVNGLVTYDRRLIRMDEKMWKKDIQRIYRAAEKRYHGQALGLMEEFSGWDGLDQGQEE